MYIIFYKADTVYRLSVVTNRIVFNIDVYLKTYTIRNIFSSGLIFPFRA